MFAVPAVFRRRNHGPRIAIGPAVGGHDGGALGVQGKAERSGAGPKVLAKGNDRASTGAVADPRIDPIKDRSGMGKTGLAYKMVLLNTWYADKFGTDLPSIFLK